jgi:hypothetical protein
VDIGVDTIENFDMVRDRIILDTATFTALEDIATEFDTVTSNNAAASSEGVIVYNSSNGNLYYNANGSASGFGGGGQFASLDGAPELNSESFLVRG